LSTIQVRYQLNISISQSKLLLIKYYSFSRSFVHLFIHSFITYLPT